MVARKVISYCVEVCLGTMGCSPDRSRLITGIINSIFAQKMIIRQLRICIYGYVSHIGKIFIFVTK